MSSAHGKIPPAPGEHDPLRLLQAERHAHEQTRRKLEDTNRKLERCLADHASELELLEGRFQNALHGARVYVFSQDHHLRYTFISKPIFGLEMNDILGNTDEDVIPAPASAAVCAAKRAVLAKGQPLDMEFRVELNGNACWFDIHIEPLRGPGGTLIGLNGAMVDITERKEHEAHLRLLMRELTHRSKNLLAVIQAMARQTAKHARSTERFLQLFSARLQALARSHDLLVQESWYGASLYDLVRSQLGHYLDREKSPVSVEGPVVQLKPEAAQSIGLALHELATNAAKYGSLSRVRGRVRVTWNRLPDGSIELRWVESKGPKVSAPKRQGFGSMVIEHNLARAIDAKVDMNFAPDGLRTRIVVPDSQLLESREA